MPIFDILIKNAAVIDGSGSAAYVADVGVAKGKIQAIGHISVESAGQFIDGSGLILAPGFIDSHSHADLSAFADPGMPLKLAQGITTEICGNCGLSPAPVSPAYFSELRQYLGSLFNGELPHWEEMLSFRRYLEEVEALPLGTNLISYVGHGTIRIAAMGMANRPPTSGEMEKMKAMTAEAMQSGAKGLSSGLIYPPGAFTGTDELAELCKVVSLYGGVYATHLRSEAAGIVPAIEEAIEIGRKTGVPVVISHHKVMGVDNWGKSAVTLALIERARQEDVDVSVDQYPYTAGATLLRFFIPPEFHQGENAFFLERLKDQGFRQEIRQKILLDVTTWENLMYLAGGFAGVRVLGAKDVPQAEGKTLAEYANIQGVDPFDSLFDLVIASEGNAVVVLTLVDETELETIMRFPHTSFSTDGILVGGRVVHPRITGSYPKILGRYVREKGILSLEEAVRKMTSLPAATIGIKNKGLIKETYDADLVLFDPERICDLADYQNPALPNEGIRCVMVNGRIAMLDNNCTQAGSGRLIRWNKNSIHVT